MAKQQPQVKGKTTGNPQKTAPANKQAAVSNAPFIFTRENYYIMAMGFVLILIGFALMSGGNTNNPNVFPKEELYSFRRITLAPIVIMLGFGIEIFAILKRPKK